MDTAGPNAELALLFKQLADKARAAGTAGYCGAACGLFCGGSECCMLQSQKPGLVLAL